MKRRLFVALLATSAALPLAARASDKGEKKPSGGDNYVRINTVTAYTTRPGARRGVMTVDCGLDIPDPALRQRAELVLPRLRAAFVQAVQIYAGGLPAGAPPNPEFLARNLQRSADEVLGKKGARVLMGAILVN
ncbi:Tat pathway signal protein [Phenylobacterium sp. LjRoot219]|uniref:Tat pathway signal protein n=1 Tax=Phenylobacterium sp. LjRoot219 TaxID=3342283 RepID=UPI003ECDC2FF